MKTYYTNEVRFLLPTQCVDRSITAFMVPKEGSPVPPPPGEPGEFSVILTREAVPAGLMLPAIVSSQLDVLASALTDFTLQKRQAVTVDNLPAEQVEFTWLNSDIPMRQQQTHFLHQGILVSITGTALEADFSRHRDVLNLVLTTMKLND
jgi:hypothetical protein